MSVTAFMQQYATAHGYKVLHADGRPAVIVIGEHHDVFRCKEAEAELIRALGPTIILYEGLGERGPQQYDEPLAAQEISCSKPQEVEGLLLLFGVAVSERAFIGGGVRDREDVVREYLAAHHPAHATAFGPAPCEGMKAFMETLRGRMLSSFSPEERTLMDIANKAFSDEGFFPADEQAMADKLNFYGWRFPTLGIYGASHVRSPRFQSALSVPYIALDLVPEIPLRPTIYFVDDITQP